ncbi:aminotransferase class V-fold PLP-dependent enzyme [Vitiosangium sp. GDMCC 1.1324]|uniref:aminotransferase class V-fold PLP-dependent enzyme n=1 Tax=Vitiosangium sp. (strain GDMCC 1.1324) TaxID=2138576 RepID=UPI000D3C67D3|nr:aminotransferase class V-fold PLP-dependent enzyme [Vitiosangium sp. GDMCC 1.1324]PTL78521.1 aminotransferase [Vitiosangium sp. GDMCC 1.1324]
MDVSPFRSHWSLDPEVTFLNHGSYGACPTRVLEEQSRLRARMEAEPVRFLHRELEALADSARAALGSFLDADPDDLAFVNNATTGVNTVLQSLRFAPGDELLTTDHEYNASKNALDFVASRWGVKVVVAKLPWPVSSSQSVVDAVLAHVTERTRLLLIDHVSSQTALVLPIASLIRALRERGVETLVDGAHGPGQVPLSLRQLGVAYYTGNCHKWLCAPKGAAFLYVRRDLQPGIRPVVISHGYNSRREDRSRFRLDFDWIGTDDPTPFLCVPKALEVVGGMLPGGWPEVMASNRSKALAARAFLCQRFGVAPHCPEDMMGSMATVPLPDGFPARPSALGLDPLQDRLLFEHHIEVPIVPWPRPPHRHVRVSAQLYNSHGEYQRLAEALEALLR